jgi:Mg2+/Co2+ transporter CorB
LDAERTLFLNFIDPHLLFGGVSLVILLVCSALISGAEVALFSLSKSDLEPEENTPSKALETIIALLHRPKKLLATILVANNFINIGIVLLFASLSEHLFKGVNSELDLVFFKIDLVFFIEVIIITFFDFNVW